MATKSSRLFRAFLLWAGLLIVFGVVAGILDTDWPILIPLVGAFLHSLTIAMSKA